MVPHAKALLLKNWSTNFIAACSWWGLFGRSLSQLFSLPLKTIKAMLISQVMTLKMMMSTLSLRQKLLNQQIAMQLISWYNFAKMSTRPHWGSLGRLQMLIMIPGWAREETKMTRSTTWRRMRKGSIIWSCRNAWLIKNLRNSKVCFLKRELSYQLMKIKQNKILKISRRPRKEYLPRIYQMKYRKFSIKTLKLKGMSFRIMTISLMKMN